MAHLLPGIGAWALWFFGLLPIFDDLRWIPATLAIAFLLVSAVVIFRAFGTWGTVISGARDYGEDYEQTFSPRVGVALGWLRWFLQIVLVFVMFIPTAMTVVNIRWWHVAGTEELNALPDRAATIPVMTDWQLTSIDASETGIPEFINTTEEGPEPSGFVEQRYAVDDSFTFEDLQSWLEGSQWTTPSTGAAFGAIEIDQCKADSGYCDARVVPPKGEHAEYFIHAQFREPASRHGEPEVEVRLRYHQYVPPVWDVSDETVDRAQAIPVPEDWREIDASGQKTNNGETFDRHYRVPESFGPKELEAWMKGPEWTSPASGAAFGQIEVDYCKETASANYACSAMVAGTERVPGGSSSGPIESIGVSLDANQTVRVHLERNG
ncbi:MAG TPA: hypothetical protein VK096_01720 [Actinomycetales bacterium]|nr:hypothetical protein [Actinomycetales bacterium]